MRERSLRLKVPCKLENLKFDKYFEDSFSFSARFIIRVE